MSAASRRVALPRRIVRKIDKLMRPAGVSLSSYFRRSGSLDQGQPDSNATGRGGVFDWIFETNHWGSGESVSGIGSEDAFTARYRAELVRFITEQRVASLIDAPCGDLNWMPKVVDQTGITYIGGDVSSRLIERVRQQHPTLDLRVFDVCSDSFPEVEAWHCRDCLFHLSFADIWLALENFASSSIRHALITTHRSRLLRNRDIVIGGSRLLDLQKPPFSLPEQTHMLKNYDPGPDFPEYVGTRRRDDTRARLSQRAAA